MPQLHTLRHNQAGVGLLKASICGVQTPASLLSLANYGSFLTSLNLSFFQV
jgi:hypothetical protein